MNKDFLRKRRIEVGLSQEYIADKLGYSTQTISLWENGKATPNLMVWSRYASLLKIDLEGLILDKDKKDNCYSDELMFDANKFADELRRLRKQKELTQIGLSKTFNINVGLIIKFEKGKSFPNVKQFVSLCVFYKLSFDELYFSISLKKVVNEKTNKKHFIPLPILVPIIIVLGTASLAGSTIMISNEINRRNSINYSLEDNIDDIPPNTDNPSGNSTITDDNNDPSTNNTETGNNQENNEPFTYNPEEDPNHIDIVLNDNELTFGLYPQHYIFDNDLIAILETLSPNEQHYYEYDGNLYEKCQAKYTISHESDNWFDNDEKVINGNYYWFKVEPIIWEVINEDEEGYLVISKDLIDASIYDDHNSNNYKESYLRSWLNNEFLNKAFYNCKDQLVQVEVNNSIECTFDDINRYVCENTFDYVFAPSKIEFEQYIGFPFYEDKYTNNNEKVKEAEGYFKAKTSEYCRCKDGYTDNYGYGIYWSRIPESLRNYDVYSIYSRYRLTNQVNKHLDIRPLIKIHK